MPKSDLINNVYEFAFTDKDFHALRDIVTGETGIELPEHKKSLMYSRLVRRVRALNLGDFAAYVSHVQSALKSGSNEELMLVVNAMTTNVTAFFREKHHFDHLHENLSELVEHFGTVNIWSSACSIGAEPWSAAMTVHDYLKTNPQHKGRVKLYATDIDSNAVATAQKGVYAIKQEERDAHPLLKKYLQPTEDSSINCLGTEQVYHIHPELKQMVNFSTLNLLKEWKTLPFSKAHVVFCRNVIIYFSKDTQRNLFVKYEHIMPPQSVLYIGHSESLINVSTAYNNVGRTSYIKKDA